MPSAERRTIDRSRVPLPVSVLPYPEGDPVDADCVDLSPRGACMRAPLGLQVGSALSCRFACPPEGTELHVPGQVVWVDAGGERAAFGVSFVDVDTETQALIEEVLAEQVRSEQGPPEELDAKLVIDGVSVPILASVAQRSSAQTTFEQELPLLQIGRGVLATEPRQPDRRGRIASVSLRLERDTPKLLVQVCYDSVQASAHTRRDGRPAAAGEPEPRLEDGPVDRDTWPDLEAPAYVATPRDLQAPEPPRPPEARMQAPTLREFESASEHEHARPPAGPSTDASAAAAAPAVRAAPPPPSEPDGHGCSDAPAEGVPEPPRIAASEPEPGRVAASEPEPPRIAASDLEVRAGAHSAARPFELHARRPADAPSPDLHRAAARLGAWLGRASGLLSAYLTIVWRRHSPAVAEGARRGLGSSAKALSAAGRALSSRWARLRRRRRTTASLGGGKLRVAPRLSARSWLLAAAAVTGGTLAVYALRAPSDEVPLHRDVSAAAERHPAPAQAPGAATPVPPAKQPAAGPPATGSAADKTVSPPAPAAIAPPPAEELSPAPEPDQGAHFGATEVADGRRFTLRMTNPVRSLEGASDKGGFTVIVPGTLSLDRAGPIASAHPAVQRSMILNKGDHAELTVRFAEDQSPPYRVRGDGKTLEILIGN